MKHTKYFRKIASDLVFWFAFLLIAVVAIPAALLIGVIYLIWAVADFFIQKLDADPDEKRENGEDENISKV